MLSIFVLLLAATGMVRLALSWLILKRFGWWLGVPQSLAGALVILMSLPDWISPIPNPFPLSVTLGVLLPDLLSRR